MTDAVRIGNCSGFYGDRIAAMREMLTGGELDFLTGDYLAELTMLILGRDKMKNPDRGYAKTFLGQLEQCLGLAHDRGVRIGDGPILAPTPDPDTYLRLALVWGAVPLMINVVERQAFC